MGESKTPVCYTFHPPAKLDTMLHAWVVGGAGMYAGLFRRPPTFDHFGAEIPTSVLLELVPVGS